MTSIFGDRETQRKAAKSLRSIAALQKVADIAWGFPNLAPAFWTAVVGASPLPLSHAGRTFNHRTTSPPARKAANPLPLHRRTPKRGRHRTGFPNCAAASWSAVVGASPLPLSFAGWTFIQPIHIHTRSKAAKSLRSIAALQNVADIAWGFPNCASASWSAGRLGKRFTALEGRLLRPGYVAGSRFEAAIVNY
jgi:hypothetical protein